MPCLPITAPLHINPLACLEYIDRIQSNTHKRHREATTADPLSETDTDPWKGKLGRIQMLEQRTGLPQFSYGPGTEHRHQEEDERETEAMPPSHDEQVCHQVCMPPTRNTIHYIGTISMLYGRLITTPASLRSKSPASGIDRVKGLSPRHSLSNTNHKYSSIFCTSVKEPNLPQVGHFPNKLPLQVC